MSDNFRPGEVDQIAPAEPSGSISDNRRARQFMTGLFAIAALLGFGLVLVYAYNKGKQERIASIPPIIKAQEGPSKIRPENPGGMKVPNQDKEVFSRLENGKSVGNVERLLPPPEKPMTPPVPPDALAPEDVAEVSPSAGGNGVSADGNLGGSLKITSAPAGAREVKPLKMAPPALPAAKKTIVSKSKPKPKLSARTRAYWAQVASLRSRSAVNKNWVTLKQKYPDLLRNIGLSIQKVTLGGGRGTYYRMQAGPLASNARATALCSSLNKRKQSCIVVRR